VNVAPPTSKHGLLTLAQGLNMEGKNVGLRVRGDGSFGVLAPPAAYSTYDVIVSAVNSQLVIVGTISLSNADFSAVYWTGAGNALLIPRGKRLRAIALDDFGRVALQSEIGTTRIASYRSNDYIDLNPMLPAGVKLQLTDGSPDGHVIGIARFPNGATTVYLFVPI
jgi:hypothetical protein